MVINFKEIPEANTGSGFQDTFELFSRDFLEELGFEILQHPDRGPDGKKDMIIGESRIGAGGKSYVKWLVSCKHFAFTGKSVTQDDELDIYDRTKSHQCNGFMGVYSTLPAASLHNKLEGIKDKIEFQIFDRERIEKKLLSSPEGLKLAKRYFPISLEKYLKENPKPVKLFQENAEIICENCGKNLLEEGNGIFVALEERIPDSESEWGYKDFEKDLYFSCKGACDSILKVKYQQKGLFDAGWSDIDDLLIPTAYLRNIMSFINSIAENGVEKNVLEKMKHLYMNTFPHISRELTEKDKERLSGLMQLWSTGLF